MALKKLMQMLGLEAEDDPNEVTAEMAGLTDDEMGELRQRQHLRDLGMEPAPPDRTAAFVGPGGKVQLASDRDAAESMAGASRMVDENRAKNPLMVPPPERKPEGLFINPEGEVQRASSPEASRNMADASRMVERSQRGERERAMREAMALLGDTAREHNLPGMFPTSPQREELLRDKEKLGDAFARAGREPGGDEVTQVDPEVDAQRKAAAPVRSGASLSQKEQLADAFRRGGQAPTTDPAAEQLANRAETEDEQGGASDEQKALLAEAFKRAGRDPNADSNRDPNPAQVAGDSGGALGAALKLAQGSKDPRLAGLEAALKERNRLLKVADAEHNMGAGADIVAGTNFNAKAGEGTRARAEALVDSETTKLRQGRELTQEDRAQGDYESRQLDSTQRRKLALSAEERAQAEEGRRAAGEGRAVAEEGRKQKAFDVTAARSDPNSDVSKHARAEMATLYGAQWNRIPQADRDAFTADDVDRFFKEVNQKDFTSRVGAGSMMDRFEEKQVADYNKARIGDRTVDAVSSLMGRLEDPAPIQGFDAAKGWAQAQKIPIIGGLLSGAGNSAVRGTEMEGIAQDAVTLMQQIALDTSGKAVNEKELQNIERRLGLAAGQGEDAFRRAMKREFEAVQSKADRDFEALSPGARAKVEQRRLRPRFQSRRSDYAPKTNTVLGERGKDTLNTFGIDLSQGD